jgi:hypothetical protein
MLNRFKLMECIISCINFWRSKHLKN